MRQYPVIMVSGMGEMGKRVARLLAISQDLKLCDVNLGGNSHTSGTVYFAGIDRAVVMYPPSAHDKAITNYSPDVLVECARVTEAFKNVKAALLRGVPIVIVSSFSPEQLEELEGFIPSTGGYCVIAETNKDAEIALNHVRFLIEKVKKGEKQNRFFTSQEACDWLAEGEKVI